MRLNNLVLGAALATGVAFAASTTFAAPITSGTLGMTGLYQAENAAGANVALGSATAIDFATNLAGGGTFDAGAPSSANLGQFQVTQATGSFAGITPFVTFGTIHDLVLSPFGAITSFFTVGSVTFDLSSINITQQDDTGITVIGTGKFQPGTVDETAGTWSASFQTAGAELTGVFTWSANSPPVPEPATLAILGASLLGLGAVRRRKA